MWLLMPLEPGLFPIELLRILAGAYNPIDDQPEAHNAQPMAAVAALAEQHGTAGIELEAEDDFLADNFMFRFPVALFVVLAVFAAAATASP